MSNCARDLMARRRKSRLLETLESRVLASTTPVGLNLDALTDYSPTFAFVDAMKSARHFGSPNSPWDTAAAVDTSGWPVGDAAACIITLPTTTLSVQSVPRIDGTYHFSAKGNVTVAGVASPVTVVNRVYNAATDTTTADVVVGVGATQLFLKFSGAVGGAKDIHLIRPGYAADTTQVFTNEYLAAAASAQTLRFMDFLSTNTTTVAEWADRTEPTDATQATTKGAAWEYAITLANATHKDMWINVPVMASDDYVTHLAQLMKQTLDPSLHVYVEYSNEVWNGIFPQAGMNFNLAAAQEAAQPGLLNYDNGGNTYYNAWRHIAERLVEVGDLFDGVYGAGADATIRPVLASQIGWGYVIRDQLDFLEHTYGDVSKKIYAIAGAPYIDIGTLSGSPTLTVDQVFPALKASIAAIGTSVQQYTSLAAYYGIHHMMYEGGVGLFDDVGGNFARAKVPANYDPRMGGIISQYLNAVYTQGVEQALYFNMSSSYSVSGTWGLTENLSNLTGAKFTAFKNFAEAATPAVTAGTAMPGPGKSITIPGGNYTADRGENAGTGVDPSNAWQGNSFDYLLNVGTASSYAMTLSMTGWNAGAAVQIFVDGKLAGTTAVPTVPSSQLGDTAAVTLPTLSKGLHTVRIKFATGFHLHGLTISNPSLAVPPVVTLPASTFPAGVTATPLSATQMTVTWQNVADSAGFIIEHSLDGQTNWTRAGTASSETLSFVDSGLLPGMSYFYRVRTAAFTDYSPVASARTLIAPPIVLQVKAATAFGVRFGWTDTTGEAAYLIQRLNTSTGKWSSLATLPAGATSFTDTARLPGGNYYYRVTALNTLNMPFLRSNLVTVRVSTADTSSVKSVRW